VGILHLRGRGVQRQKLANTKKEYERMNKSDPTEPNGKEIAWPKVLANIPSDQDFHRVGPFLLHAVKNGVRIGVALATYNGHYLNHALNKGSYERVTAARADGKIDEAFVVACHTPNGGGFVGFADAEALRAKIYALPTISGRYGEFWPLEFNLSPNGGIAEPTF
jgi:hypothetical protein